MFVCVVFLVLVFLLKEIQFLFKKRFCVYVSHWALWNLESFFGTMWKPFPLPYNGTGLAAQLWYAIVLLFIIRASVGAIHSGINWSLYVVFSYTQYEKRVLWSQVCIAVYKTGTKAAILMPWYKTVLNYYYYFNKVSSQLLFRNF